MGNERRDDRDDEKTGEREDAEDIEVFFPAAKEAAQLVRSVGRYSRCAG